MERWRPGAIWFLVLKVLIWNVVRDLSVSQMSMLAAWGLNVGVDGALEVFTLGKLCCPIKHRNQGRTTAVGERADGLQLVWYGSDGVDGCDGVVLPRSAGVLVAQAKGLQETEKSLGTSLQTMTAPRVSDGSRILRRVDKICGTRAE